MASRVFRPVVASWNWLRMAWSTQPVLCVSAAMAIAGEPAYGARVERDEKCRETTFDLFVPLFVCALCRSGVGVGETRNQSLR